MRKVAITNEPSDVVLNTTKKKKPPPPPPTYTTNNKPSSLYVNRPRSQSATRRVTPTTTSSSVERVLSNGDIYTGSFSGDAPHGSGKYLWSDGCTYEGEWRHGKVSGTGKFTWPSGATFVGEFKSGPIEGFGTFIGSGGDTYRWSWSYDFKRGYGQKRYVNGDFYEGTWKKKVQEGRGRYVWKNGNEYVGEWRNGVISGKGVFIWCNGNRYDGQWENGVPKGNGVFIWPDGSCYIGSWSGNNRNGCVAGDVHIHDLNGTFCFGNGKERNLESNDIVFAVANGGRRSGINFPRICIWESDGEDGDITCDIIDNVEIYKEGIKQFRRGPCCLSGLDVKKPGVTISKGHKNYDLMLNLQLGIRYSVGKHAQILRNLRLSDFDPKEKFWTRFPSEGSTLTPPHQSVEFRWKDYCPMVFGHLRELFEIDPADYMLAICGNGALRELSSPGKSGSFFYLTQDDRFMIKTVKKSEVKVLIKMLPSYYQHVCQYENSLVTKFYGVHCIKPVGGQKTRFIVMGNLFCSEYRIHRRFDLKGSSHGRSANKPEDEIDETTTLKDLDLNYVFRLQKSWLQELIKQINRDCEFLEAERIMDYSLLVGLHFRDDSAYDKIGLSPFLRHGGKGDSYRSEKFMLHCRFLEAELQDIDRVLSGRKPLMRLGANMPARAERMARRSDFDRYTPGGVSGLTPSRSGEIYEVVLYFGIIDILQDYDLSKKLEHAYKSFQADPTSISAVDPKHYSKRFRDFVGRIFIEDR